MNNNRQTATNSPSPDNKLQPNSKKSWKYVLGSVLLLLLIIGLGATYWLTQQNQDIRQQASNSLYDDPNNCGAPGRMCNPGLNCVDGYCVGGNPSDYECTIGGNDCGAGSTCHCTGGDACTGTECDSSIKDSCERQGRVYTTNHQGFGMTCCVTEYVACSGSNGCCPGSSVPSPTPTPNPSNPPPTNPPPTSPPPTSPPPGPQCLNITMDNTSPSLGDEVTFTCGEVSGVDHYIFRIMYPDGIISSLNATGRISEPVTVNQSGQYHAQCQICTGVDVNTCHSWETLPQ